MRYLSVCSGIEAVTVAVERLGWTPVGFSEIDPFPRAVLQHHYPEVPLHGDFRDIVSPGTVDLCIGGTPCQSFSAAGSRKGLDDERGNLALEFIRLAHRTGSRWIVWENVPGALKSNQGRDFQRILNLMEQLGYSYAWRTLDAQYFGVPQKRRRIFLVGYSGSYRYPAAVLFDSKSIGGNQKKTDRKEHNPRSIQWWNGSSLSQTLDAVLYKKQCLPEKNRFPALKVPYWIQCPSCENYWCSLHNTHAHDCECPSIEDWNTNPYTAQRLRFITPIEAERLMGFPDNYTRIPWNTRPTSECPDTHRYKAIGNSMAVPVIHWLCKRISKVENFHS